MIFRKRVVLHNAAIVNTPQAKSVKCAVMNRDERVARFPLLTNVLLDVPLPVVSDIVCQES